METLTVLSDELLLKLADKYGTPLYVYDGDLIVKRYKELYEYIKWKNLRILYAMKANYNVGILKLLKENSAFLDTVSPSEVHLALKLGFDKSKLLYTANNITDEEMHEVQKTGVLFNIGSISRLKKYARAFPGTEVCLRFNPDVVAGEHHHVKTGGDLTKFGILLSEVNIVRQITDQYNIRVIGLHEHTGSGISETDKVFESMTNLLSISKKEHFPYLQFIDFGGGFKVPYNPNEKRIDYANFGERVGQIFSNFCQEYGKELEMYFEPGKYIVAESGNLIIEVNTIKNNNGKIIAGTNSGFPHLQRPMLYDAFHQIDNLSNPEGQLSVFDICGNICETGDCFATDREIQEIRENDKLVIRNGGAYCFSMGSIYNLRSLPAEIVLIDGNVHMTGRRKSNEELADFIINSSDSSSYGG